MGHESHKTKWCPLVSHANVQMAGGANRGPKSGDNPTWARCLGPDCMMWRVPRARRVVKLGGDLERPGRGYCGLAGKP